MNPVDLAGAAVLLLFALRGYWRGFFRETFGLLALFGGLAAAARFAAPLALRLEPYAALPVVREGLAFVGVFVVVHATVTLAGYVVHRLAGASAQGVSNRLAGVVVGAGKGGALLAFVLLFLHLFPLMRTLDARLAESRLAPPLITTAGAVIRFAVDEAATPADHS
ncbi:MAG TPA: CvpA family protein [Candidatus Binatia bacterium]|nr:CvpA family protein [Candidatus Binatia bacterium]